MNDIIFKTTTHFPLFIFFSESLIVIKLGLNAAISSQQILIRSSMESSLTSQLQTTTMGRYAGCSPFFTRSTISVMIEKLENSSVKYYIVSTINTLVFLQTPMEAQLKPFKILVK